MPYPPIYDVTYSYTGFQYSQQGVSAFPGTQLDADLVGLKDSIAGVSIFMQGVVRSDGALQNGIVTYDSLSANLQTNGLAPADAWATATAYAVGVSVVEGNTLYRCLVAHTSGVFATDLSAGRWTLVTELQAGTPGPQGNQGVQGPQGEQGPQGNPGAPGTGDLSAANNLLELTATASTARTNIGAFGTGDALGSAQVAAQSDQESASSTTLAVTPGRQKFHPSAAKAWAKVTQSGTMTLNASFNMSSVTDLGSGDSQFNLATVFSSTHYAVAGLGQQNTGNNEIWAGAYSTAAGTFRAVSNNGGSFADTVGGVIAFGDQ